MERWRLAEYLAQRMPNRLTLTASGDGLDLGPVVYFLRRVGSLGSVGGSVGATIPLMPTLHMVGLWGVSNLFQCRRSR